MNVLILVILLIGTAAATLAVSANYLNPANNLGVYTEHLAVDGFQALADAFEKSTSATTTSLNAYHASLSTATPESSPTLPTTPTATGVGDGGITSVFVAGGFLNQPPALPSNFGWIFGSSAGKYYFCLSPTSSLNSAQASAMNKAFQYSQRFFGVAAFSVSYQCGNTGPTNPYGAVATLFVVPRQVTYQ